MSRRMFLLLIGGLFLIILFFTLLWKGKKGKQTLCIFTLLTAVMLRVAYIIYTPHWARQHDVIGFGAYEGQAAYIEWFVDHLKLPDFDPRERWGFFQPPLHHVISALWIRLQLFLGIVYETACENVQILALLYGLLLLFYAYRIFRQAELSGWALTLAFALTAMHPGFILLSGSINNDALCHLFTVMSLYYAMNWYRSRSYTDILKTACFVGLSMMTKLSGVLSAPAIAFLFLTVWIRGGKKDFLKYLKQYLAFACISFPLGLWFPVRSLLRFGVPLTYTPAVGEALDSYSLSSRLFDLRTDSPFVKMISRGDAYDEFNIPLSVLKTSLFGDTSLARNDLPLLTSFAWLLLFCGAILAVTAFCATIHVLAAAIKRKTGCIVRIYWGITYATAVVFLLRVCFSALYFSSQDFRYIQYVIVIQALFLGLSLQESGCRDHLNLYGRFTAAVLFLFAASVCAVYLLLGCP